MPRQKQTGPLLGPREHEPDAGALRQLLGEPGEAVLEGVGVERCHGVKDVEERVGSGRDHAHAVSLVGLGVAPPEEVLVDVVEEVLEESRSFPGGGRESPPRGLDADAVGASARPLPRSSSKIHRSSRRPPLSPGRAGRRLAVVGEHVEIVLVLGDAPGHAPELADRAVHPAQRRMARRLPGPKACAETS